MRGWRGECCCDGEGTKTGGLEGGVEGVEGEDFAGVVSVLGLGGGLFLVGF